MANVKKYPIWKHAKKKKEKFKCNFCEEVLQGGPEKIIYHLTGLGGKCIHACKELSANGKVTDDVWNEAFSELKVYLGETFRKSLNVASKKHKTEASSSRQDGGSSEISNPPINCRDEVGYSSGELFEMGKCIYCKFQGEPEKIKYHLSGLGGKRVPACKELSATGRVTDDVWNEAFSAVMVLVGEQFEKSLNVSYQFGKSLNVASKKRKAVASSSCPDGGLSEISNPPIYLPRDEVAYSLAKLLEMGGIKDNLVESPYFTNFVNAILKSGPACKLPSRSELRSQWIPSFRYEVEDYVRSAKQSWITTGCTLVPISWFNEKLGNYFLSIFGCTVERTVLLKTVEIPIVIPVADTDNSLEATAHSLVAYVGADNIVQCLRDGSVYAEHFSNVLHECIPHLKSACAANEIQSLFQRICDEVGWVKDTLALNDFDLKLNADLMQGHRTGTSQMWKIVHEAFSRHLSISHFEAQYVVNGESAHRPVRQLKLRFITMIGSPIRISQNVEGQNGCRIRVCLVDSSTGRVVKDGIPSRLSLIVSVLDGYFSNEAPSEGQFSNEASSEEHSTREYFNRNELSCEFPYITGDLTVDLNRGEGTLGNFSFNYSSVDRESRTFKLAVKTDTGFCDGFRILEGISNAFIVENVEEAISTQPEVAHVDPQNGSSSSNPGEDWLSYMVENESDFQLGQWVDTPYYPFQGIGQSLAQTAARRVKMKALTWQLQSRGRLRVLNKGSQALGRKRRGKEVTNPRWGVYSTGSNNVNQQEDGEEMNSEAVELKGIDSLSSASASAMTLFGVKGACLSGAKPMEEINEVALTTHPSNALQLSLTGGEVQLASANDVNQKEDGEPMALKGIDILKPESHAIMLFGVQVPGGAEPTGEANFPIASKPEMNLTGRSNQEDVTPQDVEEKQCVEDNYESDSSVKSTGVIQEEPKSFKDNYDVFLNIRGSDTRRGFTEVLYQSLKDAGIEAFVEMDELQFGDSINQGHVNAIDNSKTCVCIFSRTYASSRWCLRELEAILQRKKDVIPVFYGVTPDDVKLKTSMYTNDLAMHETEYNKVEVQKWREALKFVGELKGFELDRMSLLDSTNELIRLITSKLNVKPKYELQHFVGMEDHVNNALSLLDIESGDKRILGIVGMGGVGKTTLAKCIFNLVSVNYELCRFLENVRAESSSLDIEMTRDFRGKKILIVLDDIDDGEAEHITDLIDTSLFGPGSRIIVSTRNRGCLEKMKNIFCYDLAGMDAERALKLFSKNAFGLHSPLEDYQHLSKQVVSISGRLPLALKLLGSFLHGQEISYWERVIRDLQKRGNSPPEELCSEAVSLCKGQPLLLQLMSSLLNAIGDSKLWKGKIQKVIKGETEYQKMMTVGEKRNEITRALDIVYSDNQLKSKQSTAVAAH